MRYRSAFVAFGGSLALAASLTTAAARTAEAATPAPTVEYDTCVYIAPSNDFCADASVAMVRDQAVTFAAQTIYGLPATWARCWVTTSTTYACWVGGPHHFRAIATGNATGVDFY